MRIEVVREAPDRLSRQVWDVRLDTERQALRLHLMEYGDYTRPSARHGWRTKGYYSCIFRNSANLPADDVPLPDDVIAEAKARVVEAVQALEVTR